MSIPYVNRLGAGTQLSLQGFARLQRAYQAYQDFRELDNLIDNFNQFCEFTFGHAAKNIDSIGLLEVASANWNLTNSGQNQWNGSSFSDIMMQFFIRHASNGRVNDFQTIFNVSYPMVPIVQSLLQYRGPMPYAKLPGVWFTPYTDGNGIVHNSPDAPPGFAFVSVYKMDAWGEQDRRGIYFQLVPFDESGTGAGMA